MPFEKIAFDADDTLWDSEIFYQDSQSALVSLLAAYAVDRETALSALHRMEMTNLPYFGYGIKSFTLSMIEAAVETTGGKIRPEDIKAIIGLGREMERHEVRLMAHTAATLARLAITHPLMLITKGDLMDQERKIAASGLAGHFQQIEIVSDKNVETYTGLLRKHRVSPERFLMIGNALRSDILPVLELGGWAVYVPHPLTWSHESAALPDGQRRFAQIEHLGLLPELVERWDQELD